MQYRNSSLKAVIDHNLVISDLKSHQIEWNREIGFYYADSLCKLNRGGWHILWFHFD